jgi:hypothetical protein
MTVTMMTGPRVTGPGVTTIVTSSADGDADGKRHTRGRKWTRLRDTKTEGEIVNGLETNSGHLDSGSGKNQRDARWKKTTKRKRYGNHRRAAGGVQRGRRWPQAAPSSLWATPEGAGLPIQCEMYPIEKGCDQIQTSSF